jgi:hypothetical protein
MTEYLSNLLEKQEGVSKPQKKFLINTFPNNLVDARQRELSEYEPLQ